MGDVNTIEELVQLLYNIETRYPGSPLIDTLREVIRNEKKLYNPLPITSF